MKLTWLFRLGLFTCDPHLHIKRHHVGSRLQGWQKTTNQTSSCTGRWQFVDVRLCKFVDDISWWLPVIFPSSQFTHMTPSYQYKELQRSLRGNSASRHLLRPWSCPLLYYLIKTTLWSTWHTLLFYYFLFVLHPLHHFPLGYFISKSCSVYSLSPSHSLSLSPFNNNSDDHTFLRPLIIIARRYELTRQ